VVFNILIVMIPCFWVCSGFLFHFKQRMYRISLIFLEFQKRQSNHHPPKNTSNSVIFLWYPMLKLLALCADLIRALPFIISLFFLKKFFVHYRDGEIFNVRNALIYPNLGVLYLIDALFIKSFSQTLMILAVTMTNPPGSRYLSISFGTPNLSSLFYGVLVIIVSWVMLEGKQALWWT